MDICVFVIGAGARATAGAQISRPSLAQLARRVWTTRDGFLWIGGATGLFRFDGVRFERYEPPDRQVLPSKGINALWAAADGALWVGYRIDEP